MEKGMKCLRCNSILEVALGQADRNPPHFNGADESPLCTKSPLWDAKQNIAPAVTPKSLYLLNIILVLVDYLYDKRKYKAR
jgi:hypothetical protein